MKRKLKRRLENFGTRTTDSIRKKIKKTDTIDTGALLKSIDFDITKKGVEFSMLDYGQYTDEGTSKIKPRKFFNEVIEKQSEEELDEVIFDYFKAQIDKKLRK